MLYFSLAVRGENHEMRSEKPRNEIGETEKKVEK
jgi:hypothetical protein